MPAACQCLGTKHLGDAEAWMLYVDLFLVVKEISLRCINLDSFLTREKSVFVHLCLNRAMLVEQRTTLVT